MAKVSNIKISRAGLFTKKRVIPFIIAFALIGGYFVYRSFAYTPKLKGATGEFVALTPARIMDTRDGNGGYSTPIPAKGNYTLQVAGRGGMPATNGQTAVVLNVVAVRPSSEGSMSIMPSNISQNINAINFNANQNVANQVTVPLGTDGKVRIYSSASTHVVVDVVGYYSSETGEIGARYQSLDPSRLVDTRNGTGNNGSTSALSANGTLTIPVVGVAGVPTNGASSVVVNVVPVSPVQSGYTTMWPGGIAMPTASSVNFEAGKNIAKLVTMPVGSDGTIKLFTSATSHYVVDIVGYYSYTDTIDKATQAGRYKTNAASYDIFDTTNNMAPSGTTARKTPLTANETVSVSVASACAMPITNVRAVTLNVTSKSSTGKGYLSIWPSGSAKPNTSVLNYETGKTISNQVIAKVGKDGKINLFSSAQTHVNFTISGCFVDKEDDYGVYSDFSTIGFTSYKNISKLDRSFSLNTVPSDSMLISMPLSLKDPFKNEAGTLTYGNTTSPIFMLDGSNSKVVFRCYSFEKCKSLVPNSSSVATSNGAEISSPLTFAAGSYKLSQTVMTDSSGYPGIWIKHSLLTPNGTTTDLMMSYSNSTISMLNSSYGMVENKTYSCDSKTPVKITFGSYLADGAAMPFTIPTFRTYGANCPGYSKFEINQTATDSSAVDLYTLTLGIPKSERDITAPAISNFVWDEASKSVLLQASDNQMISSCFIVIAGYAGSCPEKVASIDKMIPANVNSLQQGINEAKVTLTDNSGNTTEKLLQFTVQ